MYWKFNTEYKERYYKCRICKKELEYNFKYCKECSENRKEDIEKYEQKLENRRKYHKGDKITSIEEFEKQDFVYWHGVIRYKEFIKSMQYRTVMDMIFNGVLYKAVKK